MGRERRRFLAGSALAILATAGCLSLDLNDESNSGNGAPDPGETAVVEHPRIDEPPYSIRSPPNDPDEWNELYLCEYMPPGSDLEFETVSAPRLTDPLLPSAEQTGEEYAVRVLDSEDAVREVFDVERSGDGGTDDSGGDDAAESQDADDETETGDEDESTGDGETEADEDGAGESTEDGGTESDGGGEPESRENGGLESGGNGEDESESEEPIDEIDFEENVLLVVESGYGSGSIAHHWERVETTDGGFRLHGCYAMPYERTDDVTSWYSTVRVERPEDFEFARVSLTTSEDERVHFNSTEGLVAIEKDV